MSHTEVINHGYQTEKSKEKHKTSNGQQSVSHTEVIDHTTKLQKKRKRRVEKKMK